MGKCLKNNDDTNNTSADPMVRVEALSTAGQTVALLQNLRVDAGCTVRGPGSGAACTRVMTDWGRERQGNTRDRGEWRATSWLGSVGARKPSPHHTQSPFSSHTKSRGKMCQEVVTSPELPTLPFTHLLSMFSYLSATLYLVFVLNILYAFPLLIFIATLWDRNY